jgi:very-short-patch-repair endonuclease
LAYKDSKAVKPSSPLCTPFFGRKIYMLKCMRCGKDLLGVRVTRAYRRKNYLCVPCIKETKDDLKEILKYKHKYDKYQKKLNRYKEENLKKITYSAKTAEEIIKKICESIFNFKVQQEVIFEPYILDFVIRFNTIKIGVEIDGGIHNDQIDYDEKRDQFLSNTFNLPVFRFKNEFVQTEQFGKAVWLLCLKMLELWSDKINEIAKLYGFPLIGDI